MQVECRAEAPDSTVADRCAIRYGRRVIRTGAVGPRPPRLQNGQTRLSCAAPVGKKRIHFVSLGCPKNRVDTEVMVGVALGKDGSGRRKTWELTDEAEEAEVIVVNTCGFIGEAKRESIE